MSSSKGKLLVIDGIDGTGKATQTALLKERLESQGRSVVTLDFPQYENNVGGRVIKQLLRGEFGDFLALDPKAASAYYASDRRESLPKIHNWIAEGNVVILDRYVSSNMIHQGSKIKDPEKAKDFLAWLDQLEYGMMELPRPDAIFYLDVSAEVAADLLRARAVKEGGTRDEVEGNLKHMIESRECALNIVGGTVSKWVRIICSGENNELLAKEVIHEKIYQSTQKILAA